MSFLYTRTRKDRALCMISIHDSTFHAVFLCMPTRLYVMIPNWSLFTGLCQKFNFYYISVTAVLMSHWWHLEWHPGWSGHCCHVTGTVQMEQCTMLIGIICHPLTAQKLLTSFLAIALCKMPASLIAIHCCWRQRCAGCRWSIVHLMIIPWKLNNTNSY